MYNVSIIDYLKVSFENGESSYTFGPVNADSEVQISSDVSYSGTNSLKISKVGTSSNEFGFFIQTDDTYDMGNGTLFLQLYVPKEFEDTIRSIRIYFYDPSNNYIIVYYMDKDNPQNWWGLYSEKTRWKSIASGTGRYQYYGLNFRSVNKVAVVFKTANASDTATVYVDDMIFHQKINVDLSGDVLLEDILRYVAEQGPYVEQLVGYNKTFLVRSRLVFFGNDARLFMASNTLLVDELASWTRYSNYTMLLDDLSKIELYVGDISTNYSPTNHLFYNQISNGYPWGMAIRAGTETNAYVRAFGITARNEHRLYFSHGEVTNLFGTGVGVFPRGKYYDRKIKNSFWNSVSYALWVHELETDGVIIVPTASRATRTEYMRDQTVKNLRVVGDHGLLINYTFWSSEPPALRYSFWNVLSYNASGEVYGFSYYNPNLTSSNPQHLRHETGMEVKIQLVDDEGNPIEGATVRIYGSQSGLLWEETTDSNGETPLKETLIKWWEGDITTQPITIYDSNMIDERPHEIEIIWGKNKVRTRINIFYNDLPLYYQFVLKRYPRMILNLGEVGIIKPTGEKVPILTV